MLIGGATAWVVISNPSSRILPIVLGIFGYTYGSLLGIFLLGALTKTRGSDRGNLIAMGCGFLAVAILSGLPSDLLKLVGQPPLPRPDWLPLIAFPWADYLWNPRNLFCCSTLSLNQTQQLDHCPKEVKGPA